jgi:hypothetical protein
VSYILFLGCETIREFVRNNDLIWQISQKKGPLSIFKKKRRKRLLKTLL